MKSIRELQKELLSISNPSEWQSFLFNIQTTLIESGHIGSMTEAGRTDFASKFLGLFNFFEDLQNVKKES